MVTNRVYAQNKDGDMMSNEGFTEEVFDKVFGEIDLTKYIDEISNEGIGKAPRDGFWNHFFSVLITKARELEIEIRQNLTLGGLRWPDHPLDDPRYNIRPEYFLWAYTLLLTCGWTSWVWNDKSINKVHSVEYRRQVSKILPYVKPAIDWAYEQGQINAKKKNP